MKSSEIIVQPDVSFLFELTIIAQGKGLESIVRVGKQEIYFNGKQIVFSQF